MTIFEISLQITNNLENTVYGIQEIHFGTQSDFG